MIFFIILLSFLGLFVLSVVLMFIIALFVDDPYLLGYARHVEYENFLRQLRDGCDND